ncbi:MAG: hypothetical protein HZA03_08820 [Nitrospinae bacterium]|nr:hypothetical protein [Nitrospinota bacterium]
MKKPIFPIAVCVCAAVLLALAAPAFAKDKIIEGFNSPESVARVGKYLYISNLGVKLEPSAKDGDGYISKLDLAGNIVKKDFITGLDGPKGLAVLGNVLYVADIDHLRGFNLQSGEKAFDLDFTAEKTAFLNDIAVKDGGKLFVSATDINKIFEVDVKARSYRDIGLTVPAPNGLWYGAKEKHLYIAGFASKDGKAAGEVGVADLSGKTASYRTIIDRPGFYDGLQPMGHGIFLVSDWGAFEPGKGVLLRVDTKKGTFEVLPGVYGGPADFLYIPGKGTLYLPRMIDGKLEIRTLLR